MHESVLVISDLHIPYHHKDSFKFLQKIKKQFKPDTVINIGDLLDFHAISFHEHNPDLPSIGDELTVSKGYIKELESIKIFIEESVLLLRRLLASIIKSELADVFMLV